MGIGPDQGPALRQFTLFAVGMGQKQGGTEGRTRLDFTPAAVFAGA